MESDYTKRELDEHFKAVNERFDRQDTALLKIDNKTTDIDKKVGIQNGRVSKLESKWIGVTMTVGAVTVLFGIICSLIVYSFNLSQENLRNTIILELKK